MTSLNEVNCGAAGEIRTPEVRHHWISNPAQWPGYAITAVKQATDLSDMNMTVGNSLKLRVVSRRNLRTLLPYSQYPFDGFEQP